MIWMIVATIVLLVGVIVVVCVEVRMRDREVSRSVEGDGLRHD